MIPIRTPFKLTNGPCTLAVTTIDSVPVGWLPTELGPGPFDPFGYATWLDIWEHAEAALDVCVQEQRAGISWIESQDRPNKPTIGIFFCATGSQIDRVIGPRVNSVFVLHPGVNVTEYNSTIVDDAVASS